MSTPEASIRSEQLTIPTYPVGPGEKNPLFYTGRSYQGAKGPVYPYPMLDKLSDVRRDVRYEAIYLENPYIQVCVLPEIGGRVLSALDKTNGYDFVYRQHVIKPALIGMLGAWISGGIEWDIPHHHRPTTFMPVEYSIAEGPAGQKTLWIGETERRNRTRWIIGMTIHPDRSYLEVTTRIFNRTPYAQSILCFTNVAVHVDENYQVIFPPATEYGTQHAKPEFIRWPVADGRYGMADYSGVDVSWWKNHPEHLSIFAWGNEGDFFGGYDHGRRAGIVHVADHRTVPGKKFFTFGNGARGQAWDRMLTDEDGPYLELMAGALSDNQPDYSWLQPGEMRTATQYWYPVRDLGGVSSANREAALHLSTDSPGRVRVAVNTTSPHRDAVVLLRIGGREVLRRTVTVSPAEPVAVDFTPPDGAQPHEVEASLLTSAGRELIRYRPAPPAGAPTPIPVRPPGPPPKVETVEQLYLAGLRLEQFHSPASEPEPYYEEALRRDEHDVNTNTALGIRLCRKGRFDLAEKHLRKAAERLTHNYTHPRNGEPLYYLGLALRRQGLDAPAGDALSYAAWSYAFRSASCLLLAEMAMSDGDNAAAREAIEQSLALNAHNTRALNLKAVLARKAGLFDEALAVTDSVLQLDPLDLWARNEQAIIQAGRAGRTDQGPPEKSTGPLGGDVQSHLELACDYESAGLWDEAIDVLSHLDHAAGDYPMVNYALGYFHHQAGRPERAGEHWRRAARMESDYCFPHRIEAVGWLRSAMEDNPADARAPYYLGNLLYDHQPVRAVAAWERSREVDASLATVHRNLALAYARFDADDRRATASMEKAFDLDRTDPRVLLELDQLLASAGADPAPRLARLEAHVDVAAKRDDCLLQMIHLLTFEGRFDEALALLTGRRFHVWEGGEYAAHNAYVEANLAKGRALVKADRHTEALRAYESALEYPENLEAGRPHDGGRAPEVYWLIGSAWDALGDDRQARAGFARAVEMERNQTYLSYYQGLCHRKLGDEPRAVRCFEKLVDLAARVLSDDMTADFFRKFGKGLSARAREAEGHYLRGLGLLGKGDSAGARRELERTRELHGAHLGARTVLHELT